MEVKKFPIAGLAEFQSRLPALGFLLETPRTLEQNTLYDTPDRTLREARQLLRIRRYGDVWTLTHKRKRSCRLCKPLWIPVSGAINTLACSIPMWAAFTAKPKAPHAPVFSATATGLFIRLPSVG